MEYVGCPTARCPRCLASVTALSGRVQMCCVCLLDPSTLTAVPEGHQMAATGTGVVFQRV